MVKSSGKILCIFCYLEIIAFHLFSLEHEKNCLAYEISIFPFQPFLIYQYFSQEINWINSVLDLVQVR